MQRGPASRAEPAGPSHASARPETLFQESLGLTRTRERRWWTGPLGLALHVVVAGYLVLVPLLSPSPGLEPEIMRLSFNFAPPPPPPMRKGDPMDVRKDEVEPPERDPDRLVVPGIPSEILMPHMYVDLGVEDGYDDELLDGMVGGVPGGVVGGVPGGVPGGVIGGTGTALPPLPKPDVGPRPIRMPVPSYTIEAIRQKVEGVVVLRAIINEKGQVEVLRVVRSIPGLDEEAIKFVEARWLFQPATKNGRPVASLSELVVKFNLY